MKTAFSFLLAALLVTSLPPAQACPACKDGYAAGSKQAKIGEAYSISVLFMLGVPMTIVTVAGIAYIRHMKRINRS